MQLNVPNITITGNNNEEIVNVLQRYRKELNYLLMNLDLDNMPNVANKLTDIEGNYSIIQQDVNSILLSVGDIEGNVSALQIQADGIQTQVMDIEGNVSSLVQTAEGLQTQVNDINGNISTITQTVNGIQTRVSTAEGNISTLTQTAEGLQTRVSTAEGNISTLTQTATTLQSRIQTAEGNISTINQKVDSVTITVSQKTTIGEVVNYLSVSQSGVKINANNIDLTGITRLYSPTMSDSYAEFYGSYFALVFRGEEIFRIHPDNIAGTDIYEPTGAGLRFSGGVYFNDADVYGLTVAFA